MPLNLFAKQLYKTLKEKRVSLVYTPLAIYWIIIFIATSIPSISVPRLFNAQDKLEHFTAYFILEILLALTFHFQEKNKLIKYRPIMYSLIVVSFYAAIDEIHQYFIPGRYADVLDWTSDVFGAVMAIFVLNIFFKATSNLHGTEK